MNPTDTLVELQDIHGEWWDLTNGDRGVYLATDVKGIYDLPVKVMYEEPGNYPGARYLNHRILKRDVVFGVEILDDERTGGDSWLRRDSEWRKGWSFTEDCYLVITTPESGKRKLKLRLWETPEVDTFTDPRMNTINLTKMSCIAYDPFWYEDDVVYTAVTQTDTRFDPTPLPWPWPQDGIPSETLTITVDPSDGRGGLNPTDQPVFLKWGVPGSTVAPAEPYVPGQIWGGAPKSHATVWTIPDYSFEDPDLATRRIRMPGLIGGLRTNEVQAVYLSGKPTGGTFTLTFDGETTEPIAFDASPSTVEAALVALSNVTFNDVQVIRSTATNESQTLTLVGGPTGGTFTVTFDGETTTDIPFNASAGVLKSALTGLSNIGPNDVSVSVNLVREVQKVTLIGEPTSGTFTLTFDGETTDPLPWDANTWEMMTALMRLPNVGLWDVLVTKPRGTYQPWTIYFLTNLAGIDLQPLTGDVSGLSGGAGIDIEIETVIDGSRIWEVKFQRDLSGFDLPQMTADATSLTGGVDPDVLIATRVDGSRPYLVEFDSDLSGVDVPQLTGDASELTGSEDMEITVTTLREGETAPAENVIIDTDPRVEQVTSESGSQVWSRMNGVRFRHYVPPYTKSKTFEITAKGCDIGQMVSLRIPRPWSRPWGLE